MQDKVVLITGGTGSFGKAFTTELLTKGVKQIRIFSRDELKQAQMKKEVNDPRVDYLLGDIRDYDRLLMALEGVDICVHAAAIKRIEKAETDPQEAVKTNIQGTINVANACLRNNVQHAVLVSTDKACEPINLYGATKMVAEKVWIQSNVYRGRNHPTKFTAVRYGNVVGSRGSVIPLFKQQAKEGKLTLTHPDMTRFLIELTQAVGLVELAIEVAQGGEIFLPDLKSTSILDLAKTIAPEADFIFTGITPGEKLHEQLFNQNEVDRLTVEPGYMVIHPDKPSWPYKQPKEYSYMEVVNSYSATRFSNEELRKLI